MYDIHNFVNNFLFNGIATLSSLCCLSYIIHALRNKEVPFMSDAVFSNNKFSFTSKKILTILIHLFLIFTLLFGSNYFAIKTSDSEDIRLMPDGTYCYYVKATNEKGKTYILPANISKTENSYSVYNVYFDNGGYLEFHTCENFEFYEIPECEDQDEREWKIELTNLKTHHPEVNETELSPSADDYCRYIMSGLQTVAIILHVYFLFHRTEE